MILAHQQLVEARRARSARPRDPDRSRELAARRIGLDAGAAHTTSPGRCCACPVPRLTPATRSSRSPAIRHSVIAAMTSTRDARALEVLQARSSPGSTRCSRPRRSSSWPSSSVGSARGARELLEARARAPRAAARRASSLDFLPETREIREGDWQVAPAPADLQQRWVEITGPTDRKMVINALNSGADGFMADFEDANSPDLAQHGLRSRSTCATRSTGRSPTRAPTGATTSSARARRRCSSARAAGTSPSATC